MWGMVIGAGRGSAVLGVVLLLAACSGTSSDATTTTTTTPPQQTTTTPTAPTTTTTTAPTTTVPPATSTTADPLARPDVLVSNPNRGSIDDFDTTGDDLYRVVMELIDLFVYLEGNPTGTAEEMTALLFEPEYPFYNSILVGFRELTDNPGWQYVDPGDETLGVQMIESHDDTAVFRIADQRDTQVIGDTAGNVLKTYQGWEPRVSTVTFHRSLDGKWRYSGYEPSEALSDTELRNMIPIDWTGRE